MSEQYALTFGEPASSDDKTWGLVAHLSIYISFFIGPIVMYVLFKDKSKFIAYHSVQALALSLALSVLATVIGVIGTLTCGIGYVLYLAFIPLALLPIWGAVKAYGGEWWGFPGLVQFGK